MSEKVVTMFTNLLVTVWLARQLGPETFGTLSYLLAVVMLAAPLAALGLNALVTRELVENPLKETQIMATAAAMRVLGACAGFMLIAAWAVFGSGFENRAEQVALLILAVCNIANAFQLVEYFFQAKTASKYVVKMRVTVVVVFAGVKLLVAWLYASLFVMAVVFAAEFFALGIGFYLLYRSYSPPGIQWRAVDWGYASKLLRQSVWLILSGLAAAFYLKIDQVMLATMVDHEAVGVYAVAVRLSEVWYFFAEALVVSFFPMLLTAKALSSTNYYAKLQRLCDALFAAALLLALGVAWLAQPAITLLFGEAYIASAAILTIHIWAGVFVFMRALASKWLIAEGLLVFSLVSHGIGAIINFVANLLLIPYWGAEGAAVGTVISYAAASYFAFWLAPSTRPLAKVMTRSILLPFTLGYRYWPVAKR